MYILLLLLAGVIVYFVVANKGTTKNFRMPGRKSPREILDERFVNGEIDEETYKKMKEALRG